MTALQTETRQDRRASRRVQTRLVGRYMLQNRQEYPCIVLNVSLSGMLLEGPRNGALGENVIVYIDQLGRVQGKIARPTRDGFAIRLTSSTPALQKLAQKLSELEARNALVRIPERRTEPRVEPDVVPLPRKGSPYKVLNVSASGAELQTEERPAVGTVIRVGTVRGEVARHTTSGVAIEFIDVPDSWSFTDRIVALIANPAGSKSDDDEVT